MPDKIVRRVFDDLPGRMKMLPINERGFPVSFFVSWIDGKPEFRVVDPARMVEAVRHQKCWICGQRLGAYKAFVIGPMCGINRTISEPPSHRDCAIFAAKNCPFMANSTAKKRERDLPENHRDAAGTMIKRNPGAVGVWVTKSFRVFRPEGEPGGILFKIGDPTQVLWFAEGRQATRAQVQRSIDTGIHNLRSAAEMDGAIAVRHLDRRICDFDTLLPAA